MHRLRYRQDRTRKQTHSICRKYAERVADDVDVMVADLGQLKRNFKSVIPQL